jgi:hypothetical protein
MKMLRACHSLEFGVSLGRQRVLAGVISRVARGWPVQRDHSVPLRSQIGGLGAKRRAPPDAKGWRFPI